MSNKFISQYTASGSILSFIFTFEVVQGRSVNVYSTLSGNNADEDADLLPTNSYTVIFDNPVSPTSTGRVLFNVAPSANTIITIAPDGKTNVTVNFSNTTPLNQDNLNKAYNQQSSTIDQDSENFLSSSLRYNINENEANINYNNKLPPLADKSFWRRGGNNIIAQDYALFVNEVEKDVSNKVSSQVNAGAINTNIAAELAGNAINTPVSGDILKVDASGNVVVDKTITNVVSGLASAHWSKKWAVSDVPINDDFGNTGFSSKYYSGLSGIAATSTSGLIDELFIYDTVSTTSKIDLIEYQAQPTTLPNKPWIDVLENSFTLYIDGKLILSPSAYTGGGGATGSTYSYTVTIKENPTLADPSYLTISPSVPSSTQITVSRGVAQGDSSTMFATGANYKPTSIDSKILNRDGSNYISGNVNSRIADRDLVNAAVSLPFLSLLTTVLFPVGSVLIRPTSPATDGFFGTWVQLATGSTIVTGGTHLAVTGNTSIIDALTASTAEHVLTIPQMPAHSHDITGTFLNVANSPGTAVLAQTSSSNTNPTGGGLGHSHILDIKAIQLIHWERTA